MGVRALDYDEGGFVADERYGLLLFQSRPMTIPPVSEIPIHEKAFELPVADALSPVRWASVVCLFCLSPCLVPLSLSCLLPSPLWLDGGLRTLRGPP